MDAKILATIVTGGFALVVAVFSLLTSIITNRSSGKVTRKVEAMKQEFARAESKGLLMDKEISSSLDSLKKSLHAIQNFKDELQLILSSVSGSLDIETAFQLVDSARAKLFSTYEESYAHLNESEAMACHRAKNITLRIAEQIKRFFEQSCNSVDMSTEQREILLRFRNELTDCQQLLRDSRTDRLVERMSVGNFQESVKKGAK